MLTRICLLGMDKRNVNNSPEYYPYLLGGLNPESGPSSFFSEFGTVTLFKPLQYFGPDQVTTLNQQWQPTVNLDGHCPVLTWIAY